MLHNKTVIYVQHTLRTYYYFIKKNKIVSEMGGEKINKVTGEKGIACYFCANGKSQKRNSNFLMLTYGPSLCMHDL